MATHIDPHPHLQWTTRDWVILVVFALIAAKFQATAIYDATPLALSNADSASIAGFLSGWLYPNAFPGDLVLDEPGKYRYYITLVLPLVAFVDLAVDDLGTSFMVLMFPIVVVQCLGFFLLTRRIGFDRFGAFTLALVSLAPIWTTPGDLWGIHHVPLVRMVYSALFPYLLLLSFSAPLNLRRMCGFAVAGAFGLYVHSLSGLGVTAACFLAMPVLKPEHDPWRQWLGRWLVGGVVFGLLILPYVIIYVSNYPAFTDTGVTRELADTVASYKPAADAQIVVAALIDGPCCNPHGGWGYRWLVWGGGVLGLILAGRSRQFAPQANYLLTLGAGLVFFSIGVTYVDQRISEALGRIPAQFEMVRNVRFLLPVLFIGFGLLMRMISDWVTNASDGRWVRFSLHATTVVLALIFAVPYFNKTLPGFLAPSTDGGRAIAERQMPATASQALTFLKSMDHPTLILPLTGDELALAVRYAARQPVAHIHKDRNALMYSSHPDIVRWRRNEDLLAKLQAAANPVEARRWLCEILETNHPDVILLNNTTIKPMVVRTVEQMGPRLARYGSLSVIAANNTGCSLPTERSES